MIRPTTVGSTHPSVELTDPAIEITRLRKSFGRAVVLDGLDLAVGHGGMTAVLGASGSGKTTLLRIIAGFERADEGVVRIGGAVVDDGRRGVRPQHRGVGYVPQDAALFPHLSVAANIGFGVPRRNRAALAELIDLVGLTGYERHHPHQLSGGQAQRVALARALAIRPRVVLLDEPFGSLDAGLRESVRAEVVAILAAAGTTTILVTHDQDEALSIADHVALLDGGRIVARGTPRELYDHPPTPEIGAAIGIANVLAGRCEGSRVRCALGELPSTPELDAPADCRVMLRPEQIVPVPNPSAAAPAALVTRVRYHGHDTLLDLRLDAEGAGEGHELVARIAGESALVPGQRVWLHTTGVPHIFAPSGVATPQL